MDEWLNTFILFMDEILNINNNQLIQYKNILNT
jgi:hypothetical protein